MMVIESSLLLKMVKYYSDLIFRIVDTIDELIENFSTWEKSEIMAQKNLVNSNY